MWKRSAFAALISLLCLSFSQADQILTDTEMGYSIFLPSNWVRSERTAAWDVFYDETGAYESQLSIIQYMIDDSVYDHPDDWSRANIIAYKMYLELSCDSNKKDCYPFGTVIYFDTADVQYTPTGESLWTCTMYMRFFGLDTVVYAWDEYVRYTAVGNRGYELYAIGDTVDMTENIPLYGAMLSTAEIHNAVDAVINHRLTPVRDVAGGMPRWWVAHPHVFDAQGRRYPFGSADPAALGAVKHGVYLRDTRREVAR